MLRILLAAFVALAASATTVAAQQIAGGRAKVAGVLLDSATGRAIIRARICRDLPPDPRDRRTVRCTSPDTAGWYVLDSLPAGTQTIRVWCSGRRLADGRSLVTDTLDVGDDEEGHLDVRVDATGCDMRPFVAQQGVFEGRYTPGFESSAFLLCGDSISAWAEFSPAAVRSRPKWPKPNDKYYPTYFVRWRGTLRGPWRYGHLGASAYEFVVDSILAVKHPGRSDCR